MSPKPSLLRTHGGMAVFLSFVLGALSACSLHPESASADPRIVTTIPPAAAILREIVGDTMTVESLLPPGASPHAYELRPSDARKTESAVALVVADPTLDGWARRLPHREILVLHSDMETATEEHSDAHGHHENPHFWMDPVAVAELVPGWVHWLSEVRPDDADTFERNGARFADRLAALDREIAELFEPFRGEAVIAFHGSFERLFERYGLRPMALVEPVPGHESSPKHLERLITLAREENVKSIFTEPQLSKRSAEVVAKEAGAELVELDPLGGTAPVDDYAAFIRWNAEQIAKALQ